MTDYNKKDDPYKETVFLPKTDFPMRGALPVREPEILKKWRDMGLYDALRTQNKDRPKWILHDGPPYANGHIHIGHALNKILKDVVVRSYSMLGYNTPYVPGWDCHGLPIEWKIEEKYRAEGKNKDEIDKLDFRAECREFAQGWVDIQSQEFQRLGVNGDWDTPYLTMTKAAEGKIAREIHKFAQNGLLYRGAKPVMWSTVEKTALAEAEVEYKEHKSITVWVKFPIVKCPNDPNLEGVSVIIWTTTPWTLPSNRAVAFGDIRYSLYEITKVGSDSRAKISERILVAENLADRLKKEAKIEEWQKINAWGELNPIGSDEYGDGLFEGAICAHPLRGRGYDFDVPMLEGNFVTDEDGTGFVHIAPGHGLDDFMLGMAHGVEVTDNVTDDGKFRDHVPLFAGLEVYTDKGETGDGNFAILKALNEAGALLAKGSLRHEYPHSWRSKAPLIFRTTPQWFIAMEGQNKLRERALKAIGETDWIPAKGQARISAMIENRPDWCISRQRAWGVPIALFVHKDSKEILKDSDVFDRIGTIFEDEGSDSWWSRPASDFLGTGYNPDDYEQIFDIVDVWFESGATHAFVLGDTQRWPVFEGVTQADLYLEGSDQHRGWFHSSLLESCGTTGHAPYKAVLTHGFILDDKGYKMSKSAGNVVDPLKLMEEYGADILRLWVMTSDYSEDLRIGKESLKQTSDLYRRIRNTLRFLLGALEGFSEAEKIKPEDHKEMPELEQFTLHRLYKMDQIIRTCIENYEFSKLAKTLHDFCNDDLSAFYFDIRKDRLYCDRPDSFERRACRSVMAEIFCCLSAWLAPLLAFTTEEAWEHRPKNVFEDTESVHLREFPTVPEAWQNEGLVEKWEKISFFRRRVFEQLENMRQNKRIRSSLEARIVGNFSKEYETRFKNVDWAELFIVSDQSMDYNNPEGSLSWTTEEAEGSKCSRCWKILPEVGLQKENLCNRCADAVDWYQKNRKAA